MKFDELFYRTALFCSRPFFFLAGKVEPKKQPKPAEAPAKLGKVRLGPIGKIGKPCKHVIV